MEKDDGVTDSINECPEDMLRMEMGICGYGVKDLDINKAVLLMARMAT